jgi:hypothetical protein
VKMEHFQPALDPRKQELLEARFLGTRVRDVILSRGLHHEDGLSRFLSRKGNRSWRPTGL